MENIVEKIKGWKDEIENAKAEKNQLEGKLSSIKEQLSTQFDCKTVEEAQKLKEKYSVEIVDLESVIEKEYAELTVVVDGAPA